MLATKSSATSPEGNEEGILQLRASKMNPVWLCGHLEKALTFEIISVESSVSKPGEYLLFWIHFGI